MPARPGGRQAVTPGAQERPEGGTVDGHPRSLGADRVLDLVTS